MIKGEIYELKDEFRNLYHQECYKHPFIYWEDKNADYTGIMLTTSPNPKWKNKPLQEIHIKTGFKIGFGKSEKFPTSWIAPLYLLKDVNYDHLEKTGELTNEGIAYLSDIIKDLEFTTWLKYKGLSF